jgi:NitT/TauT family transport system permease protein
VGGNMGLGYLLSYGEGAADTPMVFVTIILLTFIGIAAYLMVTWLEGRVLHYIPSRTTGAEGL